MADINNIKIEPHIKLPKLQFGNGGSSGRGGDGGQVILITEKLTGGGLISVDGGDGTVGGNAGKVHVQAKVNQFKGKISAKGGRGR